MFVLLLWRLPVRMARFLSFWGRIIPGAAWLTMCCVQMCPATLNPDVIPRSASMSFNWNNPCRWAARRCSRSQFHDGSSLTHCVTLTFPSLLAGTIWARPSTDIWSDTREVVRSAWLVPEAFRVLSDLQYNAAGKKTDEGGASVSVATYRIKDLQNI